MGAAALILGILGLVLCWIPILGLLMSLLALIFGIIATVKKKRRGMGITGIVTGSIGLTIVPLMAAIAVPAFTNYMKRAKTSEATLNIKSIVEGIATHTDNRQPLDALQVDWTPSEPCCQKAGQQCDPTDAAWDADSWRAIGFKPHKPNLYQYRVVVQGNSVLAQARGDLDCDGEFSDFSREVDLTSGNAIIKDMTVQDELE